MGPAGEHWTQCTDWCWEAKRPKDGDRQPLGLVRRFSGCAEHGGAAGRTREPLGPAGWPTPGLEGVYRRKPHPAAGGGQEHRADEAAKGQERRVEDSGRSFSEVREDKLVHSQMHWHVINNNKELEITRMSNRRVANLLPMD